MSKKENYSSHKSKENADMTVFTKPIDCHFQIKSEKVQEFLTKKNNGTVQLALERAEKHKKLENCKGILL